MTRTAHPSVGTPPYDYQWYGGNSSTCWSDVAILGATTYTYSVSPTASTYYCYKVTDNSTGTPAATALSATDNVAITHSTGSSFLGLPASEGYAVLGGILAAAAAVVVGALLVRHRKKRGARISQLV